jgi:NAD(P)H-quinone oxidoreductase subunit 5
MHLIFGMGLITAVLGGFWKLIQTDIKKMLANSTMAQMGFMFMQCGLGLFPAAIAHIICHGLFKAYLFLNSGSAVKSKFKCPEVHFKPIRYVWIVLATFIAMMSFIYTAKINLTHFNTYWFMVGIVGMSAWQLSHGLVGKNHALLDMTLVGLFSGIYGLTLRVIESFFNDGHQLALSVDPLFFMGFSVLLFIWLMLNTPCFSIIKKTRFWAWLYITNLNQSQSKSNCISSIRNDIKA